MFAENLNCDDEDETDEEKEKARVLDRCNDVVEGRHDKVECLVEIEQH